MLSLLTARGYGLDGDGVFSRDGQADLRYADGAEALLDRYFDGDDEAVREPPPELRWPLLYHLSPARQALLAPVPLRGRVLELGAGMGAVTGGLLAGADEVLAVEGAAARARVIRKRYRAEPRLGVIRDDIFALPFDGEFDVVTAIGVFEYAAEFGGGVGAPERFLASCARLLRPGGTLALAIENAFGAKYLSGCHEDHHGVPFIGVEGYDGGRRAARTYARDELCGLIGAAGFEVRAVYGCWPDYKLPVWLIDVAAPREAIARIVAELPVTPCPDHWPTRLVREPALLAAAARSDLLGYLWNSYLVLAERSCGS